METKLQIIKLFLTLSLTDKILLLDDFTKLIDNEIDRPEQEKYSLIEDKSGIIDIEKNDIKKSISEIEPLVCSECTSTEIIKWGKYNLMQ